MKTLTVDDYQRVRLPSAKPRQKLAYEDHGDGSYTLTVVRAETKEPFPPDYDFGITPARNRELLELAKASSLEVPE